MITKQRVDVNGAHRLARKNRHLPALPFVRVGIERRGLPVERGTVGVQYIYIDRIIVVGNAVHALRLAPPGNLNRHGTRLIQDVGNECAGGFAAFGVFAPQALFACATDCGICFVPVAVVKPRGDAGGVRRRRFAQSHRWRAARAGAQTPAPLKIRHTASVVDSLFHIRIFSAGARGVDTHPRDWVQFWS